MGNARFFTLTLFAFTYYVMCSCQFFNRNGVYQLNNAQPSLFRGAAAAANRQQYSAFTASAADDFLFSKPEKRAGKYEPYIEYPELPRSVIERLPQNDYNRLVSALKEMLRARDEKSVSLRPRPGRRSVDADFPLWNYFIDDVGNAGLDAADAAAIVEGVEEGLAEGSLKKSAPFKPRLGKRGENQISD